MAAAAVGEFQKRLITNESPVAQSRSSDWNLEPSFLCVKQALLSYDLTVVHLFTQHRGHQVDLERLYNHFTLQECIQVSECRAKGNKLDALAFIQYCLIPKSFILSVSTKMSLCYRIQYLKIYCSQRLFCVWIYTPSWDPLLRLLRVYWINKPGGGQPCLKWKPSFQFS